MKPWIIERGHCPPPLVPHSPFSPPCYRLRFGRDLPRGRAGGASKGPPERPSLSEPRSPPPPLQIPPAVVATSGVGMAKRTRPAPNTHTHLTLAFLGWAAPCLPAGGNPATPSLPPAPPSQRTTGLRRRPRPQRRGTSLECSFSTAASPCSGRASRGTRGTNRPPTGPRRRSRRGRRRSGRRGSRLRRRRRSRRPPGSAVAPPA